MPIDNPFSTDTSLPDLSPSGSDQAFDFDNGFSNTKPSTTFPWKTVAIYECKRDNY